MRATVTNVEARHYEAPAPYAIETTATFDIAEVLTGTLPARTVQVWAPGGVVSPDDYLLSVEALHPLLGEVGLVCLRPDTGALVALGRPAGAYFATPPVNLDGTMEGIDAEHALAAATGDAPVTEAEVPLEALDAAVNVIGVQAPGDPGYVLHHNGLAYKDLPTPFFVNPNSGDVTGEESAVVGGAATWEADAGSWFDAGYRGTTSVKRVDGTDGVQAVFWTYPPDGVGCTGHRGRIYFSPGGWDFYFNDYCRWVHASPPPRGSHDVRSTATHEFGHVLGLGHTTVTGNMMCVRNNTPCRPSGQRTLASGDIAGVRYLYPYNDYRSSTWGSDRYVQAWRGEASPEVTVGVTNLGRTPWNAFRKVGYYTDSPLKRCSMFDGSGSALIRPLVGTPFAPWSSCSQPTWRIDTTPGDSIIEQHESFNVTYRFNAPFNANGMYSEGFTVLLDGTSRLPGSAHTFTVDVGPWVPPVDLEAARQEAVAISSSP